jgi:NADH-quinone oxidoreductase subunit M
MTHFLILQLSVLSLLPIAMAPNRGSALKKVSVSFAIFHFVLAQFLWMSGSDLKSGLSFLDPIFDVNAINIHMIPFLSFLNMLILVGTPARFVEKNMMDQIHLNGFFALLLMTTKSPLLLALIWLIYPLPVVWSLYERYGKKQNFFLSYQLVSGILGAISIYFGHMGIGHANLLMEAFFFIAIIIRIGLFPFHLWIPKLYEKTTFGVALSFLQPQIATIMLFKVVIAGKLPTFLYPLHILAGITCLYAAIVAIRQTSLRKTFGYLSLSYNALGIVGIGMMSQAIHQPLNEYSQMGYVGAILVILSVGLAHTSFGVALWNTEARRGYLSLDQYHGSKTPLLSLVVLILGLTSIGFPGTMAFVAEDLVFHSVLEDQPWIGVMLVVATAINGINVLRLNYKLFAGARREYGEGDLNLREKALFFTICIFLILGGIFPSFMVNQTHSAVMKVQQKHR